MALPWRFATSDAASGSTHSARKTSRYWNPTGRLELSVNPSSRDARDLRVSYLREGDDERCLDELALDSGSRTGPAGADDAAGPGRLRAPSGSVRRRGTARVSRGLAVFRTHL